MRVRALALIFLATACTGRSAAVFADRERAPNAPLTGAWDLTLTLDRPYPLGFSNPPARRVCGTIGFVDAATSNGDDSPQSDGVYHAALAQLGLNWLDDAAFPAAVARQREYGNGASTAGDSVMITLNPESHEHIELRGVSRGSEIAGAWTAQSARGTAGGAFTLRRHQSESALPNC